MVTLHIEKKLLQEIYREAEKCYPQEACGFIVGALEKGRIAGKFVTCKNIQNDLHTKDPQRYPRDAKIAYTIDPKEMERIQKETTADKKNILAIFHSHPEHGVYFSAEDKAMAAPWGEPLFPGLSYIVVSVYGGKVQNASEFYWNEEKKDFIEAKIL